MTTNEEPKVWPTPEHSVDAPASLVSRLNEDADEVEDEIVALPRAAELSDADARQIVHGLMRVAIEAAGGGSTTARELMLDTMRDFVDSGRPLGDTIRGVSRVYMLLSSVVVAGLPQADRHDASIWLAEFASTLLRDVVNACSGPR